MVIWLPQVGHCPSCAAMDSVASSRLEQYPQLKPYRLPENRGVTSGRCGSRDGRTPVEAPLLAATPAIIASGTGTQRRPADGTSEQLSRLGFFRRQRRSTDMAGEDNHGPPAVS